MGRVLSDAGGRRVYAAEGGELVGRWIDTARLERVCDRWLAAGKLSTPPRVRLANPIRGCRKHPGQRVPTTPALERAGLRKLSTAPPELHGAACQKAPGLSQSGACRAGCPIAVTSRAACCWNKRHVRECWECPPAAQQLGRPAQHKAGSRSAIIILRRCRALPFAQIARLAFAQCFWAVRASHCVAYCALLI